MRFRRVQSEKNCADLDVQYFYVNSIQWQCWRLSDHKHKSYLTAGSFQMANQWLLFGECVWGSPGCQQHDLPASIERRVAPTLRMARIGRQGHCQFKKWLVFSWLLTLRPPSRIGRPTVFVCMYLSPEISRRSDEAQICLKIEWHSETFVSARFFPFSQTGNNQV